MGVQVTEIQVPISANNPHITSAIRRRDCRFSKLNTQPIYTPVYASGDTSQCRTQNSGPSGSLLLFS
jgi:hypothetical protein